MLTQQVSRQTAETMCSFVQLSCILSSHRIYALDSSLFVRKDHTYHFSALNFWRSLFLSTKKFERGLVEIKQNEMKTYRDFLLRDHSRQ